MRCDGDPATGTQCSTCKTMRVDCTYTIPVKTKERLPSVSVRVKKLEERHRQLEEMLKQLLPEVDFSGDLVLDYDKLAEQVLAQIADIGPFKLCRQSGEERNFQMKHECITIPEQATFTPAFLKGRHFGKSSSAVFVRSLIEWKAHEQSAGEAEELEWEQKIPDLPSATWNVYPWEESTISPFIHPSNCSFPDDDLLKSLIDLYFEHVNLFTPLLHRPTFDRLLRDKMHIRDSSLGSVVLLICSIGARFSDDPRVLIKGNTLSAGWQWFDLAHTLGERLLAPASLYDIQASVLRAEFLRGAYTSYSAWTVLGIGLRRAQDVGAHRWDTFGTEKSPERELWGRAWWSLVVLDRIASTYMGQPCITEGWDFDIDLPTECDDEYWEHPDPSKSWQQPNGVPSKVSFFVAYIKETQITINTQAFLYPLNKAKRGWMTEVFPEYDRRVVMELDSALNKWIDNIPAHLRNPHSQPNSTFHRQSIVLHAELYFLQILMHRPFLKSPDNNSGITASSIAICTNAARACSRLLDTEDMSCRNAVYRIQWPIFSSAVVLLLSVWTGKRMGLEGSYAKEVRNVEKCRAMLAHSERSWQSSGQLGDIIRSLVDASDLTAQSTGPQPTRNAPTASDSSNSSASAPDSQPDIPLFFDLHPQQDITSLFDNNLPLYTEELASIPLFSGLPAQVASLPVQATSLPAHGTSSTDGWGPLPDIASSSHTNFSPAGPIDGPGGLGQLFSQDSPRDQSPRAPDSSAFASLDPGPMPPDPFGFDFDSDLLAMWTSAPHGSNFGDWGAYVDNVNEIQLSSNLGHMRMP